MSLKTDLITNNVLVGEKSCILCSKNIEYVAIVSGESDSKELQLLHNGKEITNEVVVFKKNFANNKQLQIIEIEITVRCPHCHSKNRFDTFLTNQTSPLK
jgi:uncharacterized protein (UPF0212 family)